MRHEQRPPVNFEPGNNDFYIFKKKKKMLKMLSKDAVFRSLLEKGQCKVMYNKEEVGIIILKEEMLNFK